MKRIIILCIFLLCFYIIYDVSKDEEKDKNKEEIRVIFISYIELKNYINGKSGDEVKNNIKEMILNIKKLKFNIVILQVRSFSDAIYKSDIYPWSSVISSSEGINPGYDVLNYFIKEAHNNNIEIHAWINPYRVRLNNNLSSISSCNPAYKFINTDNLYVCDSGIYYNPVKNEVIDLIIGGVSELINNYDIDGIHFDDYFYPDKKISYQNYLDEKSNLTFEQYKMNKVNLLVKRVHKLCKKKKILFGISPSGNIENNYDYLFSDVKKWGSSSKYVDYLMPQIYYGFHNQVINFYSSVNEWDKLIKDDKVLLIPALAFYKVGLPDKYALEGSNEWILNNDIIMKEIIVSRNLSHYKGFAIYRYDYLFNKELETSTTMNEIKNIKKILK